MATALDILLDLAPELDPAAGIIDAARLDRVLALAETRVGVAFGDARPQAVALLAAHLMTVAARSGRAGAVTAEREGELARSYGAGGDDPLGATSYGREFERLRRERVFAPRSRGVAEGG